VNYLFQNYTVYFIKHLRLTQQSVCNSSVWIYQCCEHTRMNIWTYMYYLTPRCCNICGMKKLSISTQSFWIIRVIFSIITLPVSTCAKRFEPHQLRVFKAPHPICRLIWTVYCRVHFMVEDVEVRCSLLRSERGINIVLVQYYIASHDYVNSFRRKCFHLYYGKIDKWQIWWMWTYFHEV
jgi:hypothetical protein